MKFKKFKAVDNIERRIALLSGHVYLISSEWIRVPEFAWKDCYAAGCMSEDMIAKSTYLDEAEAGVVEQLNNKARQKVEMEALFKGWVVENITDNFDTKGRPKIIPTSEFMGFRVPNKLRDEVWFDMVENGRV